MIRKTLAVAGILGVAAIGISACAAAPEPDSYSEQGKSNQQVPAKSTDKATKKKTVAKWKTHMNQVELGMSMTEVKALLGKPADTDSTEMDVVGDTTTMDTWTYGNVITDDTTWVLSFTDGKLDSKSRI
jgi:hypothetical protein